MPVKSTTKENIFVIEPMFGLIKNIWNKTNGLSGILSMYGEGKNGYWISGN
jgi:hypothetical protein